MVKKNYSKEMIKRNHPLGMMIKKSSLRDDGKKIVLKER